MREHAAGREGAFFGWVTGLVHHHRARLARVVRKEGVSAEDALDCVQEAFKSFLVLPQARLLVEADDDAAKILTVLARNVARNRRRRHDRARPHDGEDEAIARLPSRAPGADQLVAQAEAYATMVGCLATLSTLQQRVVDLRLVDDVPGEDVAKALGTTPANVATMLLRAKRSLRACVGQGES